MPYHRWFYGGQLHEIDHHVLRWPKKELVRLTPIQWRVRWSGTDVSIRASSRSFNRKLRRAIEEYGLEPVVETMQSMIEDPRSFMLPDDDTLSRQNQYDVFRQHSIRIIESLRTFRPKYPELIVMLGQLVDIAPFEVVHTIKWLGSKDNAFVVGDTLRPIFYSYAGEEKLLPGFEDWGDTDGNSLAGEICKIIGNAEKKSALPWLNEIMAGPFHDKVKIGAERAIQRIQGRRKKVTHGKQR